MTSFRPQFRLVLHLALLAVTSTSAVTVATRDGLSLELNEAGRITRLMAADRPAPLIGGGGFDLWDEGQGHDEDFRLTLDDAWPAGNSWHRAGPYWQLGQDWRKQTEPVRDEPFARLEFAEPGDSDVVRLSFAVAARAVYTIQIDVRTARFSGKPRFGVVPVDSIGRTVNGWVPFDWSGQPGADDEWFTATAVVAPPPTAVVLEVYLAVENTIGQVDLGGATVAVHSGAVKARLDGRLTGTDRGAEYQATADDLRLNAAYQASSNRITVNGTVSTSGQDDRALTLWFSVPLDGNGWEWWQDLDRHTTITDTGGRLFFNWRPLAGGHLYSPFPLACVTRPAPAASLALAVPLSQPLLTRLAFRQESGLYAAFDLGLAPRSGQREASFELSITSPPAAPGFRAALDRYYDSYASDLRRTFGQAGAWFAGLNPSAAASPSVYGLLFDEQANAHLDWSRANRLLAMTSLQPWGVWRSDGPLQRVAADGLYPERPVGPEAVPDNGWMFDADGRRVEWSTSDGASYIPWCTDPDLLPDGPAALVNSRLAGRLQSDDEQGLDGVVLDGIGAAWSGWQVDNYRAEHLRAAGLPLTHSKVTRRPVRYSALGQLEYLRDLSARLRGQGKLVLGALDPSSTLPSVAPLLDVIGGGDRMPSREQFMWLRAVGYQKSLTFLDPRLLDPTVMPEEQTYIWQQCLLWGAFPGAVGWLTARQVELQRPLFRAYVPVLRDLCAAGWEPLRHAVVNDVTIRFERFGYRDDLYLVLQNPTPETRVVSLTIEPATLGLITVGADGTEQKRLAWVNRLSREKRVIEFREVLDQWQTTLSLAPRSVQVLTPYKSFDLLPEWLTAPQL